MSEEELLNRIEFLEQQVSNLSLVLGAICQGTYTGFLGGSLDGGWDSVNTAKAHAIGGGRVGLVIQEIQPNESSFSVKFKVVPIDEIACQELPTEPTVWDRLSGEG